MTYGGRGSDLAGGEQVVERIRAAVASTNG